MLFVCWALERQQVRAAQCIVRLDNVTKSVEGGLCEDAGLETAPATVQKCGLDTCPRWQAGAWTPCLQSRCFTWNTGKSCSGVVRQTSVHRRVALFLELGRTSIDTVNRYRDVWNTAVGNYRVPRG